MEENDVRRAYMHAAEFWNERVEMMQVSEGRVLLLRAHHGGAARAQGDLDRQEDGGPSRLRGQVPEEGPDEGCSPPASVVRSYVHEAGGRLVCADRAELVLFL